MAIKLGDKVRDVYTKFTGIAVGRTTWIHGCDHIGIKSEKLDKDGKPFDVQWFDEPQVELMKAQPVKVADQGKKPVKSRPGGPRSNPRHPTSR